MNIYVHPVMGHTTESMRRSIYVHMAVFTFFSTLIVTLRLYIRAKVGKIGYEDYAISFSWIFATMHSALVINEIKHGLAMHIMDIPPANFMVLMKSFYFVLICYTAAIGCFKASVLLQYLRIFISVKFRQVCYASLAFVLLFTLSFIIVAIFQCKPVHFFWDRMIPGGKCLDPASVWVTMNAINITTDLFIFFMPMVPLYKLTLANRMKVCLMLVFALGFFVVLMSIIRLPSVWLICTNIDLPWYSPSSTIWTIIELNTAIICASMPALRILGMSFIQRFVNSTRKIITLTTSSSPSGGRSQRMQSSHANQQPATTPGREPWDEIELPGHSVAESAPPERVP